MKKENVEFVENPTYDTELFNKRITVDSLDRWDIRYRPDDELNSDQLQQKRRVLKQQSELAATVRFGL